MKNAKHIANNDYETEQLKQELELGTVPAAVDEKLRQVYAELPEEMPAAKRRGGAFKGLSVTAASLAAAFLLLFGVNTAFPAFAEGLPGIGRVLESFNHRGVYAYNGKTVEGRNLDTYEPEIMNLAAESQGSELTVVSAYSDGESLSLAVKLTVPESIREQVSMYFVTEDLQVSVNGTVVDCDTHGLNLDDDYKGAYTGAATFTLPQQAEDGEELQVSLHAGNLGGKGKMTKDYLDGPVYLDSSFDLDFPVTVSTRGNASFTADAESEGAKVLAVQSLPTRTQITVTLPDWEMMYGHAYYSVDPTLYLMNGEKLQFNLTKSIDDGGYYPWGGLNSEQTCDLYFDGVPMGTEQFVLRFTQGGKANSYSGLFSPNRRETEVKAEFTIDLASGTAQASSHWAEEGALNIDSPFDYGDLGTDYMPYDESKLENGLFVNHLSFSNNGKYWCLGVVTDQPYRELKAELLSADGTVRETAYSVNEPTNAAYISGFYDERTPYFEESRPCPYSYTIAIHDPHYQPAYNETITVRLSDAKTGEMLAEQSVLMNVM